VHKAHYILLSTSNAIQKTLAELTGSFRFSDAVLRNLVVKMDEAVTERLADGACARRECTSSRRFRR